MVITKTPFRVSLCGGGSDLPAFYENICILHLIHLLIKHKPY